VDFVTNRFVAIIVIHLVIFFLNVLSFRFFPELDKKHTFGMYLILMPVGFRLWGLDVPAFATASLNVGGLIVLLVVFRQVYRRDVRSVTVD